MENNFVTFLCWNTFKKNLESKIVNIVKKHNVDVIILLESGVNSFSLIKKFKNIGLSFNENKSRVPTPKITIFSKFSNQELIPFQDLNDKLSVRRFKFKDNKEILLAIVHLPSKLNLDEAEQYEIVTIYAQEINNAEKKAAHDRTIVVGDFNMNPFEKGMIMGSKFNSVMSRKIAKKVSRTIDNREYKYFYNPMWNFFGDLKEEPLGTYYYNSSTHINYHWNIFDQVLLRPKMIDCFQYDRLKILENDGVNSLLNKNDIPDKKNASDHLPLLFTIDIGGVL